MIPAQRRPATLDSPDWRWSRDQFRRGYTDLLAVVGATHEDARHWMTWAITERPEEILGYDIALISLSSRPQMAMRGLRLAEVRLTECAKRHPNVMKVWEEAVRNLEVHGHPNAAQRLRDEVYRGMLSPE